MRQFQPATLIKLASRLLVGSIAFCACGLVAVAAQMVMTASHTASLNHAISEMNTQARKSAATMRQADNATKQTYPVGFAAVDKFRASLDSAATRRNVDVAEFRSGTDMIPFITHFAKDNSDATWLQIAVHLTLHGRLTDVISCLQDLKGSDAIYEVQSMDLSRYKITRDSTLVGASIELMVIVRAKDGKV